jgi:DNA (cytosine-5)-methyltransferase 1
VKPTLGSLYSGCGGLDLGFDEAGYEVRWANELDPHACRTYQKNFPDVELFDKSVEKLLKREVPKVNVLVGGWPCKKYSAIADIHGTRTGDNLYLHFFRMAILMDVEVFVWENVPGILAPNFRVVLETFKEIPDRFHTIFKALCPTEVGCPQRRPRVFFIGVKKPFMFRRPRGRKIVRRVGDILEKKPRIDIPDYFYKRLRGAWRDKPIVTKRNGVAPTCVAHYSKDRSTRIVEDPAFPKGVRPYTVREYARLQGFPNSFRFPVSDFYAYEQIGNAVNVNVSRAIGREVMRYFNAMAETESEVI